jgi:hypothetical protein
LLDQPISFDVKLLDRHPILTIIWKDYAQRPAEVRPANKYKIDRWWTFRFVCCRHWIDLFVLRTTGSIIRIVMPFCGLSSDNINLVDVFTA